MWERIAFLMNIFNVLHFLWATNLLELTESLCISNVTGCLGVSQCEQIK